MVTAAQVRAAKKYRAKTYERVEAMFRKEDNMLEKITNHCNEYGYIVNGRPSKADFIKKLLKHRLLLIKVF